jgi:hypothetical protein
MGLASSGSSERIVSNTQRGKELHRKEASEPSSNSSNIATTLKSSSLSQAHKQIEVRSKSLDTPRRKCSTWSVVQVEQNPEMCAHGEVSRDLLSPQVKPLAKLIL